MVQHECIVRGDFDFDFALWIWRATAFRCFCYPNPILRCPHDHNTVVKYIFCRIERMHILVVCTADIYSRGFDH